MADLSNLGLNWKLDPVNKFIMPEDLISNISKTTFSEPLNSYLVHDLSGNIDMIIDRLDLIGEGSYGKVYNCKSINNKKLAMKEISCELPNVLENTIKEAIIQIILCKETENIDLPTHQLVGPFVPRIYGIGYDPFEDICYILFDKMDNTVETLIAEFPNINSLSQAEKDEIIAITYIKLMKMLGILQQRFNFNHRDLKLDNCMYRQTKYGLMDPILIDLGFSCLNYKGMKISANKNFDYCSIPTRDPTQILYMCAKYYKESMSPKLYNIFKTLLTWKRNDQVCSLLDDQCGVEKWRNTYNFVNTQKDENPNGQIKVVVQVLNAFLKNRPWKELVAELHEINAKKQNKTKKNKIS